MITVGLFGSNGFVGRRLYSSLIRIGYKVTPITRQNYADYLGSSFDIVINAAMPSARFLAKKDPAKDFEETVQKTANIFYSFNFNKFVQISTVSARCQLDTVYGRHKLAAENICNCNDNLIFRLTSMFADDLEKGVLIDMISGGKIFVDKESRYSFSDVNFVADYIVSNLDKSGIIEVGSSDSVSLREIVEHFGFSNEFDGFLDIQEVKNEDPSLPKAEEVFKFINNKINFKNDK
jgi:dTDP-4-dehydrorhamnose reductase